MTTAIESSTPTNANTDLGSAALLSHKPQLHFWQIWNMCFGFLGIQFGFALQNANVSRIFQSLGAKVDEIPILWLAAPLTGLIVQPIVGYFSDKTWTKLGRRRPYFLYGAILASLSLIVMPNSPTLWIAAGVLWIMDASINISMEPFRAFVGDMLPEKQRTKGFLLQSFFIGTGAVIASALPFILAYLSEGVSWINISNTAEVGSIPDTVKFSFYAGAIILFLCVGWTVLRSREYSPEQLKKFEDTDKKSSAKSIEKNRPSNFLLPAIIFLVLGSVATIMVYSNGLAKELYILSVGLIAIASLLMTAYWMKNKNYKTNGLYQVVSDFYNMPSTMIQLAVVQFFSWFALFAMWIYSTDAVSKNHFDSLQVGSAQYNDGANWVGLMFAAYNAFAAIAAFIIAPMANRLGRKMTYGMCLVMGGLGLISYKLFSDPYFLLISMVGVGFAWAAILSLPYAILAGALPAQKMGVYMGIFNFFIVLPQILAASLLGLFVREIFSGEAIWALVLGGVSMFLAAASLLFVKSHTDH